MIFKLRTYQPSKHSTNDINFYIQSKGNHAGRPMRTPKANCWIVETDIFLAYEICTILWVSKIYEQHIIGSVIPFLRMKDYLKITLPYMFSSLNFEKSITDGLTAITNFDLLIDNSLSKLKLVKALRIATACELLQRIEATDHHNVKTPV